MRDRKRTDGLLHHALDAMRADLRTSRLLPSALHRARRRTPEKAAVGVSLYYLDKLSDE